MSGIVDMNKNKLPYLSRDHKRNYGCSKKIFNEVAESLGLEELKYRDENKGVESYLYSTNQGTISWPKSRYPMNFP